jgi:hypothetical protein
MVKVKLTAALPLSNCGKRCKFADKRWNFAPCAHIEIYQLHKIGRNAMADIGKGTGT